MAELSDNFNPAVGDIVWVVSSDLLIDGERRTIKQIDLSQGDRCYLVGDEVDEDWVSIKEISLL